MPLDIRLDPNEARLFGVLIEKALTTPDQYPLSVHAATAGANQKSNREPVLSLSEDEVAAALERLVQKYMARKVFPMNSRVEKFCHNGKDALALESPQLAILAELLMRGPQTPGELRTRVSRMSRIDSLEQLMSQLTPLMERGFAQRLDALPGSRAERYVQLLSPDLHPLGPPEGAYGAATRYADEDDDTSAPAQTLATRVATLEAQVERLQRQLKLLADKLAVSFDDES